MANRLDPLNPFDARQVRLTDAIAQQELHHVSFRLHRYEDGEFPFKGLPRVAQVLPEGEAEVRPTRRRLRRHELIRINVVEAGMEHDAWTSDQLTKSCVRKRSIC